MRLLEAAADRRVGERLTYEAAGRHFEEARSCWWTTMTSALGSRWRVAMPTSAPVPWTGPVTRYDGSARCSRSRVRARALLGLHRLGDPAAIDEPSDVVRRLDAVDASCEDGRGALRAEVLAARSRSRAHLLV